MSQHLGSSELSGQVMNRWNTVALDIATGFMSTSRLFVTLVGCVTLVAMAVVISHEATRERVVEYAPRVFAGWMAPAAPVEASVAAGESGTETPPVAASAAVDPAQRHITQYLSRRYRVADEAVSLLVAAAYRAGAEHSLDPLLVLAVMAVESSMNPFAESPVGAQGLMQVMTRVHTEKFEVHGGHQAALDPIANIQVGAVILKDMIRRGGSVERGLQLYVGAGNLPDDGGYGGRVLAERGRIEIAASGKVDVALTAGMRADSARAEAQPVSAAPAPNAAGVRPLTNAPAQAAPANAADA